jgi:para-nitrobenzyl esterase
VPAQSWSGVRDALRYGPTPQRKALAEVTTIPEPSIPGDDILNLNVFTPRPRAANGPEKLLPVLVYIHGGGYVAGSPASPWYNGVAFNRDGVVTVSVSYRLGFDGFGWLPDAPPNRGILDWILALEWVRDNIGQFGGDPARVTIAGQSAYPAGRSSERRR